MLSKEQANTPPNPEPSQGQVPSLPRKTLVTYYPLAAQKAFEDNESILFGKPYYRHFNRNLYIYEDVVPAIHTPISADSVLSIADAPKLLEPGYLDKENGWCALRDGTAYVSSLTRFPGTTGDMIRWWFWWHSVAADRYALSLPYGHIDVKSSFTDRLFRRADLPDTKKWLGATHRVVELVGAKPMTLRIHFVDPAKYGLPWDKLREAGYEAAVCAELRHGQLPLKIGDLLHLWRKAPNGQGLELRSRYWLGSGVKLELLGLKIPLDHLGGRLGIQRLLAGENFAYEHFMHDQIEFTNLASFLPELYTEYRAGRLGD